MDYLNWHTLSTVFSWLMCGGCCFFVIKGQIDEHKKLKKAIKEKKQLQKEAEEKKKTDELRLKRLDALEKYFNVAKPATKKAVVIVGYKCSGCDKDYMTDESIPSDTLVCPHCFKVSTNWTKIHAPKEDFLEEFMNDDKYETVFSTRK